MKPAPFDLYFPTTVAEACAMLRHKKGDTRILAGGQTLLPSMGMRVSEPASVIALSKIQELSLLRERKHHWRLAPWCARPDLRMH